MTGFIIEECIECEAQSMFMYMIKDDIFCSNCAGQWKRSELELLAKEKKKNSKKIDKKKEIEKEDN